EGTPADASLAAGSAGEAIFFTYLAEALSICPPARAAAEEAARCRAVADARLEHAIAAVAETVLTKSLYGGFTGVAWTLEHLGRRFAGTPKSDEEGWEGPSLVEDDNLGIDAALE